MPNTPFNWQQYIISQTKAILDRFRQSSEMLYLEIGGHFLVDDHASRVLPGYIADSKTQILKSMKEHANISVIFCINAKDVVRDRQFSQKYLSFEKYLINELKKCERLLEIRPEIAITMIDYDFIPPHSRELETVLREQWYNVFHKYLIDHYPNNSEYILSAKWYGRDDHILSIKGVSSDICVVAACGSNSGKLNTCLSQLYLDRQSGINSRYAKFETFPIQDLPRDHPINLAYGAATADIEDYNMIDAYLSKDTNPTNQKINYDRDIKAFNILQSILESWKNGHHIIKTSQYPETHINTLNLCISNDKENERIIFDSCRDEMQSRLQMYNKLLLSWNWEEEAVMRCKELLKRLK